MMKKSKTKKLDFKKTNVVELNSDNLIKIIGGSDAETTTKLPTRISISVDMEFAAN